MAEFNIRTDAVDVEQIMRQIRARIRDKRGVDYTEEEIEKLAAVKLEKFLDPTGLRSDLVQQFAHRPRKKPEPFPEYEFEEVQILDTHRGLLQVIRRLLQPVLKLFFNPNPLVHAVHLQSHTLNRMLRTQKQINEITARRMSIRDELDELHYEVIHNLVLETTRLGIEVKNLKMRVESLSSRLDFDERRARVLEGAVQYRTDQDGADAPPGAPDADALDAGDSDSDAPAADGSARRRRRRRRGRRGRGSSAPSEESPPQASSSGSSDPTPASAEPSPAGESADRDAPSSSDPTGSSSDPSTTQ